MNPEHESLCSSPEWAEYLRNTGDGTAMPYEDESFDSVGSFTMLHHVPTAPEQYRLLSEAWRVLRTAGRRGAGVSLSWRGSR